MATRINRMLEKVSELSFFFDSTNRDNDEEVQNLNRPKKLVPTSLYPDHDYDAVRLSLLDFSIPKRCHPMRVPGRNKLYLQNESGNEYICTVSQDKDLSNAELAAIFNTDGHFQNMSDGAYVSGSESLHCVFDVGTLEMTFSIVPGSAWVAGSPQGYFRFDLGDRNGDSCHEYLGFPTGGYSDWMCIDPTQPVDYRIPNVTNPVGSIVTEPMSEYPSSHYLRTSLPGTNIDCADVEDGRGGYIQSKETRRSRILARIIDPNVLPGQCINLTSMYPHQHSTTVYTKQMPDQLSFWLTDLDGNLSSFKNNWTATFTLEFLQYIKY